MAEGDPVTQTATMAGVAPLEIAQRRESLELPSQREPVFQIKNLTVEYGRSPAMKDVIPSAKVTGEVLYHGQNLYASGIDPVQVRRHIGMVFQKPNPFPKSIFDNVAWGLRVLGMKDDVGGRVQRALESAALWDEVKDRLKHSALSLSGGQQQRLCIARAIAVEPEVLL